MLVVTVRSRKLSIFLTLLSARWPVSQPSNLPCNRLTLFWFYPKPSVVTKDAIDVPEMFISTRTG